MAALLRARTSIWKRLDLSSMMQAAIGAAVETTGLDTGAIYLLQENVLYLGATTPPLPAEFPDTLRYANAIEHPHIMRAIDTESPVSISDLSGERLTNQERDVIEMRGLCSILYVPLISRDRPIGVFMVGSVGSPRAISDADIDASRTLALSIALALDDAHLFDSLMNRSDSLEASVRDRLTALADEAAVFAEGDQIAHVAKMQQRIRQRLALLQIRDELLREDIEEARAAHSTSLSVLEGEFATTQALLIDARNESAAFAAGTGEWDLLENGLDHALDHLVRHACHIEGDPDVSVSDDVLGADIDTALLIYRVARGLIEIVCARDVTAHTSVHASLDDAGMLRLEVSQPDSGTSAHSFNASLTSRSLERVRGRLRPAGGEMEFEQGPDGTRATVILPYFSAA